MMLFTELALFKMIQLKYLHVICIFTKNVKIKDSPYKYQKLLCLIWILRSHLPAKLIDM